MSALMMNAVYIVQGEISCVVTEMKRSHRQSVVSSQTRTHSLQVAGCANYLCTHLINDISYIL